MGSHSGRKIAMSVMSKKYFLCIGMLSIVGICMLGCTGQSRRVYQLGDPAVPVDSLKAGEKKVYNETLQSIESSSLGLPFMQVITPFCDATLPFVKTDKFDV